MLYIIYSESIEKRQSANWPVSVPLLDFRALGEE